MIGLFIAGSNQAHADQPALSSVHFDTPLYTSNSTAFTATFTGQNQSGNVIFVLYDSKHVPIVTVPGLGWPNVNFSVYLYNVAEGQYNYTFWIGSWKSPLRIVTVIIYDHLQYINNYLDVNSTITKAAGYGLDVTLAKSEYSISQGYAQDGDWHYALSHLNMARSLAQDPISSMDREYVFRSNLVLASLVIVFLAMISLGIIRLRHSKRKKI